MGLPVGRWLCFSLCCGLSLLVVVVGLVLVVLLRFLFLRIDLKNKDFDCLKLLNSRADEP